VALAADQLPMTETAASGALRRITFANLFAFVRAQLGLMTNAVTAAGEWAFQSATRPTSAGTGTPAANSLITRADGDARYSSALFSAATANQDVTNSAALVDATGLILALTTGTWEFETLEYLGVSATSSGGSAAQLVFTGAGTFSGSFLRGVAVSTNPANVPLTWGGPGETVNFYSWSPAGSLIVNRKGRIVVTAAGNLVVRFAQNTAVAGNFARMHSGSFIRATRIP